MVGRRATGRILIAVALAALMFVPLTSAPARAVDWSDPALVNRLVTNFHPPDIDTSESGFLTVNLNNTFGVNMTTISVLAEPYLFVHQDGTSEWSDLVHTPIMRNETSHSSTISIASLAPHENLTLAWRIDTWFDGPHGSWLSQPIYLVRLKVEFHAGPDIIVYASRGFFTEGEWAKLRAVNQTSVGGVNITYLRSLGYDGIIPETSFLVKEEIPLWPVAIMIGVAVVSFMYGAYLYAIKRPGTADWYVLRFSRVKTAVQGFFDRFRRNKA